MTAVLHTAVTATVPRQPSENPEQVEIAAAVAVAVENPGDVTHITSCIYEGCENWGGESSFPPSSPLFVMVDGFSGVPEIFPLFVRLALDILIGVDFR